MSGNQGGLRLNTLENFDLEYQSFILSGHIVSRTSYANGLKAVPPETEIRGAEINKLLPSENSQKISVSNCQILIVVAMYNENSENFKHTMLGINQNLTKFRAEGVDTNKIVSIVIIDGIKAYLDIIEEEREKEYFSEYFDDQKVKEFFGVTNLQDCKLPYENDGEEFAHCFFRSKKFDNCSTEMKIIFCVKHFNKRKLNTHLWFFGGFCKMFKPKYVILLDVGTRPLPNSLFYMYEAMESDPNLAGCCGEIKPMTHEFWNLAVSAQVAEYKFAHIMDKALESVIGFISVLPGAFSTYRWEALWKGNNSQDPNSMEGSPLWEDYFKSIYYPNKMDAFESNIYLAEDRVLCLSLFTKRNEKYILRYVRESIAETDVPKSLSELMVQRRRWINGSWFALIDSLKKYKKIFESSHNRWRKFLFCLQMVYYSISAVYSWLLVGAFCLCIEILITSYFENSSLALALILVYIGILMVIFITSMGVKPKQIPNVYRAIAIALGLYQFLSFYLMIVYLINNGDNAVTQAILITTSGFGIIILLNWEIPTILFSIFQYLALIPSYINIFLIYSICNVHDCTWGNRPDLLNQEEKNKLEKFEEFRTKWLIIWVICNSGFSYFSNLAQKNPAKTYYYFTVIAGIGIGIILIRVIGGAAYFFIEKCKNNRVNHNQAKIFPAPIVSVNEEENEESLENTMLNSRAQAEIITHNQYGELNVVTVSDLK
jgi:chitin synthase